MDFKYIIIRASSALLLLSGPLFTACDDDDPDAFITVSKQEIEVEYNGLTANGETVNFDLGSNHAWQATYVEEWIHPTHTEGDRGRTRIFLAIDENDTGKDREGYVIFEGGGSRRTVAVTQKLKIDALMVSPGKLTVVRSGLLETGEKASVYISANSDWTIEPSGDSGWITPSKTSGKAGEEDVELTIAQNTTGAVRTGTFVVVAGSKRATVTVTQNLEGLKVSATSFRVNKFGFADEERTQRQTVALRDVRYRFSAVICPRESFRGTLAQLNEQALRRRLADAQPGFGRCGRNRGDAHGRRERYGGSPQRRSEDRHCADRTRRDRKCQPERQGQSVRGRRPAGRACLL